MKTLKKIMMAFFAFALLGLTTACEKENNENNGATGDNNPMLVGTWEITSASMMGQDISSLMPRDAQIVINANGNGFFTMNGHNYAFTWSTNGNTLTVNTGDSASHSITCNITSLTSTQCTFTSSNMMLPGMSQPLPGEVTITITKVGGSNPQQSDSSYSALLPGTWQVDSMFFNGQDITAQEIHGTIQMTFYANGTGLLNDNGETQNNDFQWVINGDTITVTTHGHPMVFTINRLTATECTFSGSSMRMGEQTIEGDITIHMVKINS